MIRRLLARTVKNPTFWVVTALTVVPLVFSFLHGWPPHGYGLYFWLALPVWFWFRHKAQRKRLAIYAGGIALQFLAYPHPDLGFLGWVMLWPYLIAREIDDDGAHWFRAAYAYGFMRAIVGFYWLGNVHYTGWLTVTALSGLAFALIFELALDRWHFAGWEAEHRG